MLVLTNVKCEKNYKNAICLLIWNKKIGMLDVIGVRLIIYLSRYIYFFLKTTHVGILYYFRIKKG